MAAVQVGKEIVREVAGARTNPQVMVRIDDGQIRLENRLRVSRQPVGSYGRTAQQTWRSLRCQVTARADYTKSGEEFSPIHCFSSHQPAPNRSQRRAASGRPRAGPARAAQPHSA